MCKALLGTLSSMKVKVLVTQSCPTLVTPPGSSVHGIFHSRILEGLAISFSREFPNPGIKPWSPALQADSLPTELLGKPCTALTYSFLNWEPVHCFMSGSNCCFLICIQISQEAGQVVWYSHLFRNFPQFVVIHTVDPGVGIELNIITIVKILRTETMPFPVN